MFWRASGSSNQQNLQSCKPCTGLHVREKHFLLPRPYSGSQDPDHIVFDMPFGTCRTAGYRAVMFEIKTKDGNRKAFAYSYLVEADHIPETGIIISVSDVAITITGRSMSDIYNYLLSSRLTYVQEDYSGLDNEDSDLFIESIEIKANCSEM